MWVMGWRESHSWFVLSHILVFVLCLAWQNPRLLHNDLVKISTVRELLKESCEVFQNKSTFQLGFSHPLCFFLQLEIILMGREAGKIFVVACFEGVGCGEPK